MTIKAQILKLFEEQGELSVKELVDRLQASKQMVHLVLKQLVENGVLDKLGRPPKTIYRKANIKPAQISYDNNVSQERKEFLNRNFLIVTETGNLLEGIAAFSTWCSQRSQPLQKTVSEFVETKKKYEAFYDQRGNINGIEKLRNTKGYDRIWLDDLYYLDFYAIERFGKTRLGTLLHYAKQGQNKYLMNIMMNEVAERIRQFVKINNADAVGFVPPTIRREVQLMKFIQARVNLPLPVIDIKKLSGIIPVPQKSLSKLDERIRNAENSFAVTDQRKFERVVLIDDAIGSGATINQIAGKLKVKEVAQSVIGLAVVGSFKGFDVITDV